MDEPLVFHWSDPLQERAQKIGGVVIALLLVSTPIVFFSIFSMEQLAKIDWHSVWQKLLQKPSGLVAIVALVVFYPMGIGYAVWATSVYKKRARIWVQDDRVRYVSGVPWIGKWMDWTWDLEAIRSQKLVLKAVSLPLGGQPLRLCRLTWGQFINKQMRPYVWQIPGTARQATAKPRSFLGLVRWGTPENAALLQQQFDQLPLIAALKQRGVALPPLSSMKQHYPGTDLMAYPRMKSAVWSFFGTLTAAFALFHVMRHQHYFSAPPASVWIGMGVLAGLGMLAWLWQEQTEGVAQERKKLLEFRYTQVVVASLFAVAAGLCAPSLPLALSSLVKPAEETVFTLQKFPLLLRAPAGSAVPDFAPQQALDYWASLAEGEKVALPVRPGFAKFWWQFDSSVLGDKLEPFPTRYESEQAPYFHPEMSLRAH